MAACRKAGLSIAFFQSTLCSASGCAAISDASPATWHVASFPGVEDASAISGQARPPALPTATLAAAVGAAAADLAADSAAVGLTEGNLSTCCGPCSAPASHESETRDHSIGCDMSNELSLADRARSHWPGWRGARVCNWGRCILVEKG